MVKELAQGPSPSECGARRRTRVCRTLKPSESPKLHCCQALCILLKIGFKNSFPSSALWACTHKMKAFCWCYPLICLLADPLMSFPWLLLCFFHSFCGSAAHRLPTSPPPQEHSARLVPGCSAWSGARLSPLALRPQFPLRQGRCF